jgi:hypothetical protein
VAGGDDITMANVIKLFKTILGVGPTPLFLITNHSNNQH